MKSIIILIVLSILLIIGKVILNVTYVNDRDTLVEECIKECMISLPKNMKVAGVTSSEIVTSDLKVFCVNLCIHNRDNTK